MSLWKNAKFKGRKYLGRYAWGFISDPSTERVFVLECPQTCPPRKHVVCVFSSHEEAKRNGWRKICR